jgi:hypothetical protein
MIDTSIKPTHQPDYTIEELRMELDPGGTVTLWYDLSGPEFAAADTMTNLYADMSAFLDHLSEDAPEILTELNGAGGMTEERMLEKMDETEFDWEYHLRRFIDQHVDLKSRETERIEWARERSERAVSAPEKPAFPDISSATEDKPLLTDAIHAFVDSLNDAAVAFYPGILDYNAAEIDQVREILEVHSERIAIQLAALEQSVAKNKGNRR